MTDLHLPDLKGLSRKYSAARAFPGMKFSQERIYLEELLNRGGDRNKLRLCTTESLAAAIIQAGSMGLSLNPILQHLYLIPRRIQQNPDVWTCTASPSYRGLIHLLVKNAVVTQFVAQEVFAGDQFSYHGPLKSPSYSAVVDPSKRSEANAIGVYTEAVLSNGGIQASYTDRNQILEARSASDSSNSAMWTKFWTEGWKKTAIRKAWKTLPMNEVMSNVEHHLNVVEGATFDNDTHEEVLTLTTDQINQLESIIGDRPHADQWLQKVALRCGVDAPQAIPATSFGLAEDLLKLAVKAQDEREQPETDSDQ